MSGRGRRGESNRPRCDGGSDAGESNASGSDAGESDASGNSNENGPSTDDRATAVLEIVTEPVLEYAFVGETPVVKRINDAFAETFGVTESTVRERPLEGVLDARSAANLVEADPETDRYDGDVRRPTNDGYQAFRLRIVPLDDDGRRRLAKYSQVTVRAQYERKLEALHEATRELIKRESKEAVAQTAVDAAVEILELEATSVHLLDRERNVLPPTATTDSVREILGEMPALPVADSLAGSVLLRGEPVAYDDPAERPEIFNPDTPFKSEVIIPIGDHGVLLSAATEPGTFGDFDVSLATILASNTEAALDRLEREEKLARRERELAEKNERLEAFASMVSHDLRNPLTVAQGHVEIARRHGDMSRLEQVIEAHDRIETLIEELLELARHGNERGQLEEVTICQMAKKAWSQVRTGDADLVVEALEAPIEADPNRLASCFENLFRNSIEHGTAAVTIRVGPTDRGFFVADDGPGIPPEECDDVFEEGYSGQDDGTGMGLAIVAEVTEAHDWDVALEESRDGGARFEFDVDTDVDEETV